MTECPLGRSESAESEVDIVDTTIKEWPAADFIDAEPFRPTRPGSGCRIAPYDRLADFIGLNRIAESEPFIIETTDEADLQRLLAEQGVEGGSFLKLERDPRITGIGRLLRKTSLDELPQLFNVVTGDMNLVGPRPQTPAEVASYDERVWRRLLVRPGITGLWQISGRSSLTPDEAHALDEDYVRNWTPLLDLTVLAKTPVAVVFQRGAV